MKISQDECFDLCKKVAKKYGYDEFLIYSIIETESNRRVDVVSKSGAVGLMQISKIALQDVNDFYEDSFTYEDLFIAEKNIEIGSKFLYKWINYFLKDLKGLSEFAATSLGILTYCWGFGNVQKWLAETEGDNQKITEFVPFEKLQYHLDVIWWYVWAKKYFGGGA